MACKKVFLPVLGLFWAFSSLASDSLVQDALYLVEDRMGAKCEKIRSAGEMKSPKICFYGGDPCRGTDTYRCVDRDGKSVAIVKARFIFRNDQALKIHKLSIQLD